MFKYGSFRNFVVKFFIGIVLFLFGLIYLTSLYSYSPNDPGFNQLNYNINDNKISNLFGFFGAYLSSYSLIFIGTLSYLSAFFIAIEGGKLFLGITSRFIILKFLSNLTGIIIINVSLKSIDITYVNFGLISQFLIDLFTNINLNLLENIFIYFTINLLLLIFGIILVLLSFKINLSWINKTLYFLKFFKYFRFLFSIFKLLKYVKFKNKSKKKALRSEPTIKKSNYVNLNRKSILKPRTEKQLELDSFSFNLPSKDLLSKSNLRNIKSKELDKVNTEAAIKLEKTLSEYGVDGKIIGFSSGPIVTLFEFVPNAGIKSSKVIGLSDDIARAMSSFSARISTQPGKTSLGIEIPNTKRESVMFGDLIEEEEFEIENDSLTLALGKDISGKSVFANLERMPHLLIAGTTGSGKSVGINTMILSILYKFKPNECKLILIDPKMLELSIYEDIPHLLTPVVTDPKKAVFALKWVVREMENRYKLMSSLNVKNIDSYNAKVLRTISSGRKLYREVQTGIDDDTRKPIIEKQEILLEKMPFIVVVIDEMADLMMVAGKEVESLVQRLAQMARASGIHLITATQRPSVDVITGTIKANFPSRISYKVSSKFDSRTILNEMGAEQLLGSGDMLFLENGGIIKRLHGGFVSESEVDKVVSQIKRQATFDYKKEISLSEEELNNTNRDDLISSNNDDLYTKAVDIVIKQQKVSTSYIQRYLQIGYNRAARIVEKMEEDGIISEANNAGKRHVLKK
ncbi:DNA translocase FtsK 4TM domain-containing protein [Pelagibacteraceae bacterium]|nr:DNA translocase FtsK 4TM domain-containing protein [Pelagibacteraceae bacterium]